MSKFKCRTKCGSNCDACCKKISCWCAAVQFLPTLLSDRATIFNFFVYFVFHLRRSVSSSAPIAPEFECINRERERVNVNKIRS